MRLAEHQVLKLLLAKKRGGPAAFSSNQMLLIKKDVDACGGPSGDATSEEVSVLRPNRTTDSKGCCQNRSILKIARPEPLPCLAFEVSIDIVAHRGGQRGHHLQKP